MMANLLNSSQRRWITIVLHDLEASLRKTQDWLDQDEEHGILCQRSLDLPPENRAIIEETIPAALAEIEALAREFNLPVVVDDLGSRIVAEMNIHASDLDDTHSKALKRYGDVDPGLAEVLDPRLDRLSEYTLLLARLGG